MKVSQERRPFIAVAIYENTRGIIVWGAPSTDVRGKSCEPSLQAFEGRMYLDPPSTLY